MQIFSNFWKYLMIKRLILGVPLSFLPKNWVFFQFSNSSTQLELPVFEFFRNFAWVFSRFSLSFEFFWAWVFFEMSKKAWFKWLFDHAAATKHSKNILNFRCNLVQTDLKFKWGGGGPKSWKYANVIYVLPLTEHYRHSLFTGFGTSS